MLKIKMNQQMKRLYSAEHITAFRSMLIPELEEILHGGFVEIDQCIVLRHQLMLSSCVYISSFPDKTGYEAFVNLLHIDDFLSDKNSKNASTIISLGIAFSKSLARDLSLHFPEKSFYVILGIDCRGIEASVKFYQQRDGESWLVDDVDEYLDEAILVFLVNVIGE